MDPKVYLQVLIECVVDITRSDNLGPKALAGLGCPNIGIVAKLRAEEPTSKRDLNFRKLEVLPRRDVDIAPKSVRIG
ncbi:hypothetical protein PSY31_23825, partial [Shigella flexneri]|nr:hypothetical protein [Shigella flexneri]